MTVLGKRKASKGPSISAEDANAIFQRHFESQFFSLRGAKVETAADEQASSSNSDSGGDDKSEGSRGSEYEQDGSDEEWGGLSEDEAVEDSGSSNLFTRT